MSTQLSVSDKQLLATTMLPVTARTTAQTRRRTITAPTCGGTDKTITNITTMKHTNPTKKLTRSASIEKIMAFNAYICSQQFYILPAVLSWLRSSQMKTLQPSLERCIGLCKYYFYTSYIYTTIAHWLATLPLNDITTNNKKSYVTVSEVIDLKIRESHVHPLTQRKIFNRWLLIVVVYLTQVAIFFQLAWCLYTLSGVWIPGGLIFQCTCIYAICHINYRIMTSFLAKEIKQQENVAKTKLSAKKILGDRTISNFNLF